MDLPIFSDNLKSSASWIAALESERKAWDDALAERGDAIRDSMHRVQLDQVVQPGLSYDEARLIRSMKLVSIWSSDAVSGFGHERLIELHRALIGATDDEDVIRKTEPAPLNAMHDPAPAILVPRMLDNAFDWFGAQSFGELHPVEQSSVVFLRLLDLHPFETGMELTALLAAGYYTQRAGLPPLVIYADEATRDRYRQAVEAAFRMLTQPLVEFFSEMLARAMKDGLKNGLKDAP